MPFEGFTEDDIRSLTNKSLKSGSKVKFATIESNKSVNKKPIDKRYNRKTEEKTISVIDEVPKEAKLSNEEQNAELPKEAKLNNTKQNIVPPKNVTTDKQDTERKEIKSATTKTLYFNGKSTTDSQSESTNAEYSHKNETNISTRPLKFRDLKEFLAHQKNIEEENKKRKELLLKTLADKTKQTQEEAARLHEINLQCMKLDNLLTTDVNILRKQIEMASFDFMEAEKKFLKAEKDYLEAKLQLQQKKEKKEMLTEHLCAIIEKNEERKAAKLNELLQRLELKNSEAVTIDKKKEVCEPHNS